MKEASEKYSDPWYKKPGLIYFVGAGKPPVAVKIGVTQQGTINQRIAKIQSSNHEEIHLLGCRLCPTMLEAEREERILHEQFKHLQRRSDWAVGYEWFTWSEELQEYINDNSSVPEKDEAVVNPK